MIFDDVNNNARLDLYQDTIYGLTDVHGQLAMEYQEIKGSLALQAFAPGSATQKKLASYDRATYAGIATTEPQYDYLPVSDDVVLRAPAASLTAPGESGLSAVISSITDLVVRQMENGFTQEEAQTAVATALGYSEVDLYADGLFGDHPDPRLRKIAQMLFLSNRFSFVDSRPEPYCRFDRYAWIEGSLSERMDEFKKDHLGMCQVKPAYKPPVLQVAAVAAKVANDMSASEVLEDLHIPFIRPSGYLDNHIVSVNRYKLKRVQKELQELNLRGGDEVRSDKIYLTAVFLNFDEPGRLSTIDFSSRPTDSISDDEQYDTPGMTIKLEDNILTITGTSSIEGQSKLQLNHDLTFTLRQWDTSVPDLSQARWYGPQRAVTLTLPVATNVSMIDPWVVSAAETELGSRLTADNLADVTALTLSDIRGSGELKDLVLFPNLTSLAITNSPQLTRLKLDNSQLTSIDVSELTNLTSLSLRGNRLTEIDLAPLTQLESLHLDHNHLSSLDLSAQAQLRSLSVSDNRLTSLELSSQYQLQDLYLNNNQLTRLDLSALTNLTDKADLSGNQLTHIDLPAQSKLRLLYLNDNQLSSLDVNGLAYLELLDASNNQLTGIDFHGLPTQSKLRLLYLNDNQLSSLDVNGLAYLEFLDASNNQLTGIEFHDLPSMIAPVQFIWQGNPMVEEDIIWPSHPIEKVEITVDPISLPERGVIYRLSANVADGNLEHYTYQWEQIKGPDCYLHAYRAKAQFEASEPGTYGFKVTVRDDLGSVYSAEISLDIRQ